MAGFSYLYASATEAQDIEALAAALDAETGVLSAVAVSAGGSSAGALLPSTNRAVVRMQGSSLAELVAAVAAVGGCEAASGFPVVDGG